MRFYFPDSQDQVDPTFDFVTEERSPFRVRQRDDLYAHEVLDGVPYDGILVSKAIVDGTADSSGRYTLAQRHRLHRLGIRGFFRLDEHPGPRLATLGDCGAFTYVRDHEPPYTSDEVIDFYEECDFDAGIGIDHVILGYDGRIDDSLDPSLVPPEWKRRQTLTLTIAAEFLDRHRSRRSSFDCIGVAQGWSPRSYAHAITELQKMGYRRVALGGMVALKTTEILDVLKAASDVRATPTEFHLLGVTRTDQVLAFGRYGVTSFDSTSPFRQAFKDDRDNFYTLDRAFVALRVPQVDANPKLKARIRAGEVDQRAALRLEANCLKELRAFGDGIGTVERTVAALARYEELHDGKKDRSDVYRETLEARPWSTCQCGLCAKVGIDMAIFRGTERNKRRGFHNVWVFRHRLDRDLRGGGPA